MRPSSRLLTSSKLEDTLLCPASFFLVEDSGGQGSTNRAAEIGTKIHKVLESYVDNRSVELAEELAKNLGVLDQFRQIDFGFVDDVLGFLGPNAEHHPELSMTISGRMISGYEQLGSDDTFAGTADVVIVSKRGDSFLVVDWKTGTGDVTEPSRNKQLESLAAMVCKTFGHNGGVWLCIAKPLENKAQFSYHEDPYPLSETINKLVSDRSEQSKEAFGKQCTYCPRKINCGTFAKESQHELEEFVGAIQGRSRDLDSKG